MTNKPRITKESILKALSDNREAQAANEKAAQALTLHILNKFTLAGQKTAS